jgi:hypothetical protein
MMNDPNSIMTKNKSSEFDFNLQPLNRQYYIPAVSPHIAPQINLFFNNPKQKFVPSPYLTELVDKHMIQPDEETIKLLKELNDFYSDSDGESSGWESILKNKISDAIEGFFIDLAWKTSKVKKEEIIISENKRFLPNVCKDLIEVLEIDPLNPKEVLDRLYSEIVYSTKQAGLSRDWGRLGIISPNKLCLYVGQAEIKRKAAQ